MEDSTNEDPDHGCAVAAAAAAATAGAIAKVAATMKVAPTTTEEIGDATITVANSTMSRTATDGIAKATTAGPPAAVRFFLRGIGQLGEHHLRDYFERYGDVREVTLVRDKKTKRPRGMAFVAVAPRPGQEAETPTPSSEELSNRVTEELHKINGVDVELQEALPKPEPDEMEATHATTLDDSNGGIGTPSAATEVVEEPLANDVVAPDPAAQMQAQAQWQMHYLALAINASVPDVRPPTVTATAPGGNNSIGLQMKAPPAQRRPPSQMGHAPNPRPQPPWGYSAAPRGGAPFPQGIRLGVPY